MLTEMEGKGGCVCAPAQKGELKCPLIVRPTSEDVLTGNLFGALEMINPRRWLPHMLNHAMGWPRFRQQVYRKLRIKLWKSGSRYPGHLLPWKEGITQVDVTLEWQNPPTTVYVEVKYLSDLTSHTARDDGSSGFPSDQLIRNIRVGLHECGWLQEDQLFPAPKRDFAVVLLRPHRGHPLVASYRDSSSLLSSIPHADRLAGLPESPFVGELAFADIATILSKQRRHCTLPERKAIDRLVTYLDFKLRNVGQDRSSAREET